MLFVARLYLKALYYIIIFYIIAVLNPLFPQQPYAFRTNSSNINHLKKIFPIFRILYHRLLPVEKKTVFNAQKFVP